MELLRFVFEYIPKLGFTDEWRQIYYASIYLRETALVDRIPALRIVMYFYD